MNGDNVVGNYGILNINNDSTNKGGEYIFNSGLYGTLEIHNGAVIRLGSAEQQDGSTTYGVLHLTGFRPHGDTVTLDLRNDHIDTHHFGHVKQDASVNHLLDIDLNNLIGDNFTADSTTAITGDILVGALNLISGTGEEEKIVKLSKNSFRFAFSLTPDILDKDGDVYKNITYATGVDYKVKTLDYDYLSGNLVFNAKEFNPNGGTLDKVYSTSKNYLNLATGAHHKYSSSEIVETRDDDHPYIVVINGHVYYFKPNESSENLNNAIIDLAATGSTAIKEVRSTDNYIFEKDGHYYTYTTAFLPKSVWEHDKYTDGPNAGKEKGTETNYNYRNPLDEHQYHNIKMRTEYMNAIDTTVWELSDAATAGTYTWPNDNIPLASNYKPILNEYDNLTGVSGMVRFNLPHNVTDTETRYYLYNYTIPSDYSKADERIENLDRSITNQYFYEISNNQQGSVIKNTANNYYNINTDFIGNESSYSSGNGAGTIYNSGKLGYISGTFINNQSTGNNGGVFFNDGSNSYIKAIIGDFIGNYTNKGGGVIRNLSGKVDLIQGKFIGNRAGVYGSNNGWGGVISNKNADSKIEIVLGDFIGNYAAKGGGAIDMNGRLGTVIGDFIANKSGDDGGGAIRTAGGIIGSITGDFR